MDAHEYLKDTIDKYSLKEEEYETAQDMRRAIENIIEKSYGTKVDMSLNSGQYRKMTTDPLTFEIDLAIYFENDSFETVANMYDSLFNFLSQFYIAAKHRFSITIDIEDHRIRIVPVKVINKITMDCKIYDRYRDKTIRTNIFKQREHVKWSKHHDVVELMRIWKYRNELEIGTFQLDIITLEALSGESSERLDKRMIKVLKFIRDKIDGHVLADPGNNENDVARTIPSDHMRILKMESSMSLKKSDWRDIVA